MGVIEALKLLEIQKALAEKGVYTEIKIDDDFESYLDLQTMAKSHLYLYGNGELKGRYEYNVQLDLDCSTDVIIRTLCFEFLGCLYGRDYYNGDWMRLCKKLKLNSNEAH